MILVAACPGGNVSNMISMLAKGNVALSVSLTAFTTVFALFMTPFNFTFWGGLYARQSPYLVELVIEPSQIFQTVGLILGIPVLLGLIVGARFPVFREKIQKPVRWASMFVLIGFIVGITSARDGVSKNMVLFWKTGVCGGFTTFSTFSLESYNLFEYNRCLLGCGYVLLSCLGCILGVMCGEKLAAIIK